MKQNLSIKILSFFVIGYMLVALGWWSVLLHRKNTELYQVKKEILQRDDFNEESVHVLEEEFARQNTMILGESLVFGLMLILGIYFLWKAYQKVILASTKQKNFLLSITHELKTPLASNKLALETLQRNGLPEQKRKELIETGIQENDRLTRLVENLLMSAKLEHNYEYHFEKNNLENIISEEIVFIQRKFPNKSINLDSKFPDLSIICDKQSIHIVIRNLLDNALKYSQPLSPVLVSIGKERKSALISVKDWGIGIDEKHIDLIFEQFQRVGNEETRTSKGTGLGLFICKEIIKAHQGTIQTENHSEGGSIFKVTLPI